MGKGKYSPNLPTADKDWDYFDRNCYGQIPPAYDYNAGEYDEKLHFASYDPEGYDSYGYSAFDADGNYVGIGNGVDRNGYTEFEYMSMSDDEFYNSCY